MGTLLIFIIGAMFGGTIGAGCMCLMQIGKSSKKMQKGEFRTEKKAAEIQNKGKTSLNDDVDQAALSGAHQKDSEGSANSESIHKY